MELYDLWDDAKASNCKKIKPSTKRRDKRPPPHPGQSYNPDPEDHKRLLEKVGQKELKYLKKKSNINKATKVNVNAKELKKHEKQELASGIEHLIKKSQEDAEIEECDSSSTDSAYSDYDDKDFKVITKDKKVCEKRKSKKQRLAQLRDKLQRKAAKLRKLKNIRSSRFDAIKKILKKLDEKEKKEKTKKHSRKKQGYKLPDPDPIYCLSEELPTNLRETKCPLDAIVREQLDSFQSRLMVEPTKFQIRKRDKYKKRQFERE